MGKNFILLLALISFNNLLNAQDLFDKYKIDYDRLRIQEKHDSALVVAKQMNAWANKIETDTSLRYAVSLRYVGNCFNSLKNIDSAKYYFDFSLRSLTSQGRGKSINAILCFHNIGVIYYNLKNYEKTDSLWSIVLDLNRQLDDKSDDFRDALNNLVAMNNDWGRYDQSEKYAFELVGSTRMKYGDRSSQYSIVIGQLAEIYFQNEKIIESEKINIENLKLRNDIYGPSDLATNYTMHQLAKIYESKKEYTKAIEYDSIALQAYKAAFDESDEGVRYLMNHIAKLYLEIDDYLNAEKYYLNLISIPAQIEEKKQYSDVLMDMGILYKKSGNYKLSEKYFKESLALCDNDSLDKARVLNNLADLFIDIGDYFSAENMINKSLKIRKNILGVNHQDYARSLNTLGICYLETNNLNEAEICFQKACTIFKNMLGETNELYISAIENLGIIYCLIGDYKLAEKYILISYNNNDDFEKANTLNNLGAVYLHQMKYDLALSYISKSIELKIALLGENHPNVATSKNNLAYFFLESGKLTKAKGLFEEAMNISIANFGVSSSKTAGYYDNLADVCVKLKDYDSGERYYDLALNVTNYPNLQEAENDYALLFTKTNREQEAYKILTKNFLLKGKQIADNFEWLNDNQKEANWKKESSFYDNLSWFANEAYEKVPEAAGLNYNAALVIKSKMLEAKISSENYYREVDELREELAYRRRLLAKMESDGSTEKEKLEKLYHEADSLDKRLTISWPEYAQQKKNLSITWDQVQQNLNKEEAAIEFVRFENEDDSVVYYNALVLKKGDKNPTLVKLCKEKDLQTIAPQMGYSAYYSLVWKPLETALNDVKTIYYAPTGELYNVPFHAIYAPKGKGDEVLAAKADKRGVIIQNERAATEQNAEYLMDRYTMHQLTSTRYLAMGIKQKAKESLGNTMAMVGGVNYDYLPGSTAAPKKNKQDKTASRSSASTPGKLNYLEGTRTEVEQINNKVTSANWQIKLFENNEAIEENITKLEGKEAKGILHLATHGYAFPEYDFKDTSISKNSLRYSYRYSTNPMVRSGLILAGGNWAWTGNDTLSKLGAEQNGILTALEVSQLNLKKTKLVVLSACETGLGKIEGSEGTFGLKRGFKLAGVEQMIVSLWSVPDKETMELMTLFYTDLTKTLNPIISFEKAQKEMRNKYPTEPEKWAGFVLVR